MPDHAAPARHAADHRAAHIALGARGERRAARWYRLRGYRLLDRNWRWGHRGEIDLILERGGVLVFCEVKTRSSDRFAPPVAAVTVAKQKRIRHLARRWMTEHDIGRRRTRFDVAEVIGRRVRVREAWF